MKISKLNLLQLALLLLGSQAFGMSSSAFKDAAQSLANGIAAGAGITLEELFEDSPGSPVANLLGSLPGPFKSLFSKMKFNKGIIRFDEKTEVVVLDGSYEIPKAKLSGRATIRFGKDLSEHAMAKEQLKPNKKLASNEAQKDFNQGLATLQKNLNLSVVLDIPSHFDISKLAGELSGLPEVGGLFKNEEKFLKPLEGLIKGDASFGFSSQNYFDPRFGLLSDKGLNIVGKLNLGAKLKGLAGKILGELGGIAGIDKGLWVQLIIPHSINGLEGEIYLPGNLKFCTNVLQKGLGAKCPADKAFLQTKRMRIGLELNEEGEEYILDSFVAGEALLRLPWQEKEPIEIDLQLDLDAGTGEGGDLSVGITGNIKEFKLGKLPIVLEDGMLTATMDLNAFIDLIKDGFQIAIDVIEDLAKKAVTAVGTTGAEAPEVAAEGAENVAQAAVGAALIETVVGAAAVEGEDLLNVVVEAGGDLAEEGATQAAEEVEQLGEEAVETALEAPQEVKDYTFPIKALGFNAKLKILGREFDVELCLDTDEESVDLIAKVNLDKGSAKDAITLKDIFDLVVELQKKEVQLAEKATGVTGIKQFQDEMQMVLKNADKIKPILDKFLKNFAIDTAELLLVPQAGKCGEQEFDYTTIEVHLAGKLFNIPLDGDVTINISLMPAPGEEEGGTEHVKQSGKGIGKAAGSLLDDIADIGIYFNGQLGETTLGPITLSSEGTGKKTTKKGPRLEFSLGFPKPSGEKEPDPVFDSIIDGKIKLNVPPGLEAGLKAKLSPEGITLDIDEQTGDSEIKVKGELNLDDLQDTQLKFEFHDLNEFTKKLNELLHNTMQDAAKEIPAVAKDVEGKIASLKKTIGNIKSKLQGSKSTLDSFDQAVKSCEENPIVKQLGGPLAEPMLSLINKVTQGLEKLNPQGVLDQVTKYATDFGVDEALVKKALAKKVKANIGPQSLQNIPGLLDKLK